GRGGTAHAVFQRLSAAVLLSDDGCDGSGEVGGGDGDGDAWGQCGVGDRVDHADRDGEGVTICDPRRRPHGGGWHHYRYPGLAAISVLDLKRSCETSLHCSATSAKIEIIQPRRIRRKRPTG